MNDGLTVNACQVDWEAMGPEGRAAFAELLQAIAQRVRDGLIPGLPQSPDRFEPETVEGASQTPGIRVVRWWYRPGKRWRYGYRCVCGAKGQDGSVNPPQAASAGRQHWKHQHRDAIAAPPAGRPTPRQRKAAASV